MMELWKDWYLLERENRNRDGEWLEIAQRKAARAEGKPVSKMTAEQWQRLYGGVKSNGTKTYVSGGTVSKKSI
jgi:hypothetical protein